MYLHYEVTVIGDTVGKRLEHIRCEKFSLALTEAWKAFARFGHAREVVVYGELENVQCELVAQFSPPKQGEYLPHLNAGSIKLFGDFPSPF